MGIRSLEVEDLCSLIGVFGGLVLVPAVPNRFGYLLMHERLNLSAVCALKANYDPRLEEKLLAGLRTACTRRPVSADDLERLVDRVESSVRRVGKAGFELWGAPGRRPEMAAQFREAVLKAGGKGLLMTTWGPVRKATRKRLVEGIRAMGPVYRGEG